MTHHSSRVDPGAVQLSIPELPDDIDNLTAALAYARAGWYVLPAKRGTKHPGSVVGNGWHHTSSRDPEQIAAWFAGTNHAIALHCGRSGVLAFDVDHPENLPGILRPHLDPAPFQNTRPDEDPERGHYPFLMPPGRTIGNSAGQLAGAWGDVRGLNGVIIAAPNPDGRRWVRDGDLPELPEQLAELLDDASPAEDAASDQAVKAFIAGHTDSTDPDVLDGLTKALREKFAAGESRHTSTVSVTAGAMKEARAGYYTPRYAIDTIWPMFLEAVGRPPISDKQGKARTAGQARFEFKGIAAWAVGQALAEDLDEVRARTNEKMPEGGTTMEADSFDDEPIPLTHNLVDVPPFPVDALPDVITQKVTELAEATQTDPAMAGTSALSTLSTCCGGHAKIQVRPGWTEPLCLHTATIAAPAERKSAVQESMVKPLHDAEELMSAAGEVEHLRLQDELDMAKKTVDQLNKAAVNAAAKAAAPDAADADKKAAAEAADAARKAKAAMREIHVPEIPRLLADDVTPEATASLLADHGGRIAIVSAEGGIFDTIAGRYARTVNMDVFLKGHSGDRIRVDRQGRPPQHIPSPALTIGLMVQPRVIEAIAANRDFVGRGLLARFLYATPVSRVGFRVSAATPVSESTEAQYSYWIKKLASEMAGWAGDPMVLTLDGRAEALVRKIQDDVEPTLIGDGELASPSTLTEWGGKYVGAVVRVAGLLHLGEHGEKIGRTYPVQPETIEAAERIGRYFKAAAVNVFAQMGGDPGTADAVYLLKRVVRLGRDEVSERDVFTACSRSRFPTKEAMSPALKRLVEHGYLIPRVTPKPAGGGRVSPRFKIHPSAADAADAADAPR